MHQGGYDTAGKGWNLSVYSGNVYVTFGGVADYIICTIAAAGFAVDGVYRVALTISGNGRTARLYVNGVQVGSVTVGTMLTPAHHSTTIGCGYSGSSSTYTYYVANGVGIGELFLYSRELTAQEVLDEYNSKDALPVNGEATGGVGSGAGSGSGGSASGETGAVNGDATGGTGTGTGSGSGGDASGQSIIIRDDYERSSVNTALSSAAGVGDAAVVTIYPRLQLGEIVTGTRWWEVSARVDGVNGIKPRFEIALYKSGSGGLFGHPWEGTHKCHYSYDRLTWYPFDHNSMGGITAERVTCYNDTAFTANTVYFANSPQMSVHQVGDRIAALHAQYSASGTTPKGFGPAPSAAAYTPTAAMSSLGYAATDYIAAEFSAQTDELGRTVDKTPLYAFEINDTSLSPTTGGEKRVAVITAGIHAAEDVSQFAIFAFVNALLSDTAEAISLRSEYIIWGYPLWNPPGRAGGHWRGSFVTVNSTWIDANRHVSATGNGLEIVDLPRAAIDGDRAGAVPDWALDFHGIIDNVWALYTPGTAEQDFYTRQVTNAGVTISDLGGTSWAGATDSVDTYFHNLGTTCAVTVEFGDYRPITTAEMASYTAAMVKTIDQMRAAGTFPASATASGGVGSGVGTGSGGSASGEVSATVSGGTGVGTGAGSGGDATGEVGGSATATGGTGTGVGSGSGGSAAGQASAVASGGTGTGTGAGSGGDASGASADAVVPGGTGAGTGSGTGGAAVGVLPEPGSSAWQIHSYPRVYKVTNMARQLPTKDQEETKKITFDFSRDAAIVSDPDVSIVPVSGNLSADVSSMKVGAAVVAGAFVVQLVGGGDPGTTYRVRCKASDPDGEVHVLAANLPVALT